MGNEYKDISGHIYKRRKRGSGCGSMFALVGAFLVVGFALYLAANVFTGVLDYGTPWANEAALRRAPALAAYFTFMLVAIVGSRIVIALGRLIGLQ